MFIFINFLELEDIFDFCFKIFLVLLFCELIIRLYFFYWDIGGELFGNKSYENFRIERDFKDLVWFNYRVLKEINFFVENEMVFLF